MRSLSPIPCLGKPRNCSVRRLTTPPALDGNFGPVLTDTSAKPSLTEASGAIEPIYRLAASLNGTRRQASGAILTDTSAKPGLAADPGAIAPICRLASPGPAVNPQASAATTLTVRTASTPGISRTSIL